jgi:hypothetical protein
VDGLLLQVGVWLVQWEGGVRLSGLEARAAWGGALHVQLQLPPARLLSSQTPAASALPLPLVRLQMRFCRQLPVLVMCLLFNLNVIPDFCRSFHPHLTPHRCAGGCPACSPARLPAQ